MEDYENKVVNLAIYSRLLPAKVLFEEDSILPLPECLEACGAKFSWGEVSQDSPKTR